MGGRRTEGSRERDTGGTTARTEALLDRTARVTAEEEEEETDLHHEVERGGATEEEEETAVEDTEATRSVLLEASVETGSSEASVADQEEKSAHRAVRLEEGSGTAGRRTCTRPRTPTRGRSRIGAAVRGRDEGGGTTRLHDYDICTASIQSM